MFGKWRANVRFNLFMATRRKIDRNLFHVKASFQRTLLTANRLCCEAQKVALLNVKPQKYLPDEFITDQVGAAEVSTGRVIVSVCCFLVTSHCCLCD